MINNVKAVVCICYCLNLLYCVFAYNIIIKYIRLNYKITLYRCIEMAQILYEPQSIRQDEGILYLTEGEACKLPFIFEVYVEDMSGNKILYDIQPEDVIEIMIKCNIYAPQVVLKKNITNTKNNVCLFELTSEDMRLMQSNRNYVLMAKLITEKTSRVLIKQLPVRVQEVA